MRNKSAVWYKRLADIPGVRYSGDQERRKKLANGNVTPSVQRFDFDGRQHVSLMWRTRNGESSASHVHEQAFRDHGSETPEATRERVLDTLELPGTPSDYHFL